MLLKTRNKESTNREKRVTKRLNLKKLPFTSSMDDFCDKYLELIKDFRKSFEHLEDKPGMRWCFKNIKTLKK